MIQRADDQKGGNDIPPPDLATLVARGHYTIHLEQFEGPLDLLLYLIQRDELEIYDIPIKHITKSYLEFIDLLDIFELDNAGEFLVMAASLMRIKARMLLPMSRVEEGEEEGDPRAELVARLLEYKKYKEAAGSLAKSEEDRSQRFYRGQPFPFSIEDNEPPELSLGMFDLLGAVRNVLQQVRDVESHHVFSEMFTVEAQQEQIRLKLSGAERIRFIDVFDGLKARMQVVVTFVAMLELMKSGELKAQQSGPYNEIWLREPSAEELADMAIPTSEIDLEKNAPAELEANASPEAETSGDSHAS